MIDIKILKNIMKIFSLAVVAILSFVDSKPHKHVQEYVCNPPCDSDQFCAVANIYGDLGCYFNTCSP